MYSNNFRSEIKIKILFPLWEILAGGLFPIIFADLVVYYKHGTLTYGSIQFSLLWLLLAYIVCQYLYVRLSIFKDKVGREYPLSFILKDEVYPLSEIDFVFFQYHTGLKGHPWMKIFLKNGRKKFIQFPENELKQAQYELENVGLKIVKAKHILDHP